MKKLLLLLAASFLMAGNSFALTCGQKVTGVVNLTADLVCNAQDGLIVDADNTTINLNGYTISCLGSGLGGSCQTTSGQPFLGTVGIASSWHNNVKIYGPGKIKGFAFGISLHTGYGYVVQGVTVTGPSVIPAQNNRTGGVGMMLSTVDCPIVSPFSPPPPPTFLIADNEINNQVIGIRMDSIGCASVRGNIIHDLGGANGYSTGIFLGGSSFSSFYRNSIYNVGLGKTADSGIAAWNGSINNTISGNVITNNCADGVAMYGKAANNNVNSNTVRYNGGAPTDNKCSSLSNLPFHDLVDSATSSPNLWNVNNACRTEAGNVPAGVCNPNE